MQKYYEKKDIKLFLGDCIEILEKATPDSVDMIFADPPYMLSNGGISCQAGKVVCVNKGKWDESKGLDDDFYKELIINYLKTYKKGTKRDFIGLLEDKLPDTLSDKQKESKVKYLLNSLKSAGRITLDSTNKRRANWVLISD